VRIFKTRHFSKWAKKVGIKDINLVKSAVEVENGLIDAELGTNLIKKRIASGSKGKKGGFRIILAYKKNYKIFFIYGFAKNDRDNIYSNEFEALKLFGNALLVATSKEIIKLKQNGELFEIGVSNDV
jgi:hypothetical protein